MSNWEIHNNSFTDCNRGIAISGKHNNITQNTFVRVDMPISGGVRGSENSNCSACAPAPPVPAGELRAGAANCTAPAAPPFTMQCVTEGANYVLQGAGGAAWAAAYPVLETLRVPASSAPSDNLFANNTWCGANVKGRGAQGDVFSSFPDSQWEGYGSTMVNNVKVPCPSPPPPLSPPPHQ